MEGNLKPPSLYFPRKLSISWLLKRAGAAPVRVNLRGIEAPHCLCGPHAKALKQFIKRPRVFDRRVIAVVENREGKPLTVRIRKRRRHPNSHFSGGQQKKSPASVPSPFTRFNPYPFILLYPFHKPLCCDINNSAIALFPSLLRCPSYA